MKKNITLKVNESFLKKCKHQAVEEGQSLSAWIEHQLAQIIVGKEKIRKSRENAILLMKQGLDLGGRPLKRDDIYER